MYLKVLFWIPIIRGYVGQNTEINLLNSSHIQTLDISISKSLVTGESSLLTSFVDMPIVQCQAKCFIRKDCIVIEYMVLHKFCRLFSNFSATQRAKGFAIVSGFNVTTLSCGNSSCNSTEVCDQTTNQCVIKGCGYPRFGHNITGNVFDVGSRAIYNSSGNIQQIQCGSDGKWNGILYNGITCEDIRVIHPNVTSGFYRNSLNMTLVCDFETDGGGWLVFQKRFDGSVNFYRNWESYKYGFGEPSGEFWLGLENLYQILNSTNGEFDLRVDMEDWTGISKYAVYDNFSISDATDFYRLHVGTYSGTAGDALRDSSEPHNGQRFSTYDEDHDMYDYSCIERFRVLNIVKGGTAGDALRDSSEPHNGQRFSTYDEDHDMFDYSCIERFRVLNIMKGGTAGDALRDSSEPHNGQRFSTYDEDHDMYDYSCAERFTGAWWYYNCHKANLNGRYYPHGFLGGYATGMLWFPWTGMYEYVRSSSMKIREKRGN